MSFIVSIKHKEALAFYKIDYDTPGVYHANLVEYRGSNKHCPPIEIVMLRGITTWTGSIDDKTLLNQLGLSVEMEIVKLVKQ